MKTILDPVSNHHVTIDIIGSVAVMYANGNCIEKQINRADWSMAKVAMSKRDLESFGSFFND